MPRDPCPPYVDWHGLVTEAWSTIRGYRIWLDANAVKAPQQHLVSCTPFFPRFRRKAKQRNRPVSKPWDEVMQVHCSSIIIWQHWMRREARRAPKRWATR